MVLRVRVEYRYCRSSCHSSWGSRTNNNSGSIHFVDNDRTVTSVLLLSRRKSSPKERKPSGTVVIDWAIEFSWSANKIFISFRFVFFFCIWQELAEAKDGFMRKKSSRAKPATFTLNQHKPFSLEGVTLHTARPFVNIIWMRHQS